MVDEPAATEQDRDGVYFSRIGIGGLIGFLRRAGFPDAIVQFAEENRGRLDHLLFDVGIDYRMEDGEIRMIKSAYYGFF